MRVIKLFSGCAGGGRKSLGVQAKTVRNKGLFAVSVPSVTHAYDRDDQLMVDDLVKNAVGSGPNPVFFLA